MLLFAEECACVSFSPTCCYVTKKLPKKIIESDFQEGSAMIRNVHDVSKSKKKKSECKFYLSARCKYLYAQCTYLIRVKCKHVTCTMQVFTMSALVALVYFASKQMQSACNFVNISSVYWGKIYLHVE